MVDDEKDRTPDGEGASSQAAGAHTASESDAHGEGVAWPGWHVLHLFCSVGPDTSAGAIEAAVKECEAAGSQVICSAMLGHKADLGIVALGAGPDTARTLQTQIREAGTTLQYSYVSLTEVSEYAAGVPAKMREARLHPVLPPSGMPAMCFYPMSKRRDGADNWYSLAYEDRLDLMYRHGAVGRKFAGRVVQLVTGSTGLDDYEWGVTLFAVTMDDLKDCVYTMRFDEASARYAEFGPFLVGTVAPVGEVLDALGTRS